MHASVFPLLTRTPAHCSALQWPSPNPRPTLRACCASESVLSTRRLTNPSANHSAMDSPVRAARQQQVRTGQTVGVLLELGALQPSSRGAVQRVPGNSAIPMIGSHRLDRANKQASSYQGAALQSPTPPAYPCCHLLQEEHMVTGHLSIHKYPTLRVTPPLLCPGQRPLRIPQGPSL